MIRSIRTFPTLLLPLYLVTMLVAMSCEQRSSHGAGPADGAFQQSTTVFSGDSSSDAVRVQWMGTAGLFVSDGESSFLIDPFVSRYRVMRVVSILPVESKIETVREWIQRLHVPASSPILLSHSHYDHALDMPNFARELGASVYGSSSAMQLGIGAGLPEEHLKVLTGGIVQIGKFRITTRVGCHGPQLGNIELWTGDINAPVVPPVPARRYKVGNTYAFHVQHPRGSFIHQASACNVPNGLTGLAASTIFLGIAARAGTHELLSPIIAQTGVTRVIPIHWDDFFSSDVDHPEASSSAKMEEFIRTSQSDYPNVQVKIPKVGEVISIGQ